MAYDRTKLEIFKSMLRRDTINRQHAKSRAIGV